MPIICPKLHLTTAALSFSCIIALQVPIAFLRAWYLELQRVQHWAQSALIPTCTSFAAKDVHKSHAAQPVQVVFSTQSINLFHKRVQKIKEHQPEKVRYTLGNSIILSIHYRFGFEKLFEAPAALTSSSCRACAATVSVRARTRILMDMVAVQQLLEVYSRNEHCATPSSRVLLLCAKN